MRADPPLNPDSQRARRLLEHELSKPKYGDRRSLVRRFIDWLLGRIDDLSGGIGSLGPGYLIALLVLLAVVIGLGLTRVRRHQGAGGDGDDHEEVISTRFSAAQLRSAAGDALTAGELSTAYLQYFRALARRGVERTLVSDRPGATAHEVAAQLSVAFPAHHTEIAAAAGIFDAVRYGGRTPDRAAVETMRDLERRLDLTRPHRHATAGVNR